MYDNKIRLSQDVLEKAEVIAQEWGLKNSRAAVEAVFRRYADEYLGRRNQHEQTGGIGAIAFPIREPLPISIAAVSTPNCDALSELDELLGL